MNDYCLEKCEKKDFILNFEEDGDTIKVNLANGEDYPVPNTKENKDNLLRVMEIQVNNSWYYEDKNKKKKKSAKNSIIYNAILLPINLVISFLNPTVLTFVAIGCFSLGLICNVLSYRYAKKCLEELNKNQIFLRNKKQINEYLARGKEEEKTLNPVNKNEDTLNINDVHSMSYEDITKIINDINRDEKFGIDRPKVLTKRYIGMKNENG